MEEIFEDERIEDKNWRNMKIENVKFIRCVFVGVNFYECRLSHTSFENCKFVSCKFNGAVFKTCALLNCTFKFCTAFARQMNNCKTTGSQFTELDLARVDINGGNWSYAFLKYRDFRGKKLKDINFTGADLSYRDFDGAVCENCDFSDCILSNTNFRKADLRKARFNQFDISTTRFTGRRVNMDIAFTAVAMLGRELE